MAALAVEIVLCVLPHPFPGFTSTIRVQALNRESIYQFESIIVIFMIGRVWWIWKLFKAYFFHRHFERVAYLLGNRRSIIGTVSAVLPLLLFPNSRPACRTRKRKVPKGTIPSAAELIELDTDGRREQIVSYHSNYQLLLSIIIINIIIVNMDDTLNLCVGVRADMFLHRQTHTDSLAIKMLFRDSAMQSIACACILLLLTAAYCIRSHMTFVL